MRRTSIKSAAFGMAFLALASLSHADWVAFNDHVPGTGTAANTTTNNIRLGTSGPLKNIVSGTNLPVNLAITHTASGLSYTASGAGPAPNTPIYNAFNGFVTFSSGTDCNVELTNVAATVTYTFTGLNAARKYSFKGGAIRAGTAGFSNRWTKVEIQGAVSFTAAHSANVITPAQAPADLTSAQAAVLFAINNTATTGDIVDWENIAPSASGSFSIVCTQYKGLVPNGGSSSGGTNYAITGIRLEELAVGPPVIVTQPTNQTVNLGATATFTVVARGEAPLLYQWYRNGSMIPGATNATYTTPPTTFNDFGSKFSVMVFNNLGNVTSANATLTVTFQPVQIMPLTNSWKYDQSGRDLGTDWQAITYDDSGWPSGRGILGLETDNPIILGPPALTNTVLSLFDPSQVRLVTYYFRTHFNLPYDPHSITLTASNIIDDAAVIYLNGQEIYRQNIVAAPARITYTTAASAAIEAAWTSIVLPAEILVQGDNVLAVEVHQGGAASSDVDWGMIIRGDIFPPTPLAITKSPPNRTAREFSPTTFSVSFTGTQPQFQWYKWVNDALVAIPGATKQFYIISNLVIADAGYYSVIVSNSLSSAMSRPAYLTVSADLSGPELVEADGTFNNTNVTVSFSELVLPSTATNIANYKITNVTAGGTLTIIKAVLNRGTNVTLTTSAPRVDGVNYLLIVNNVQDTTSHNNVITPNSAISISSLIRIVGLEQAGWDFYDPVNGPPEQPYYPGTNWNNVNFAFDPVADQWGHGAAGLFVYDLSNEDLPGARNTVLSQGVTTKYFRYAFNFNPSAVGASLRFRHVVDDGIIAYLNGTEVYRFNMPSGPVNETTAASVTVGVAASSDYIDLPPALLRQGSNVFAVELHGLSRTDLDWVFGAELQAVFSSSATGTVLITSGPRDATVEENQPVSFSFDGVGAGIFQWKTNGTAIPGATNAILTINSTPGSWNGKLISVTAANATSSATSTNARLTVFGDTTPPALLSAQMLSANTISVNFSEAISALTATNPANYRVTNSQGPNLTVSSSVLNNGTNVVLSVSTINSGTYTLVVNNVRDASTGNNLIASNSFASLGFPAVSWPIDAAWQYRIDGVDLGTNWTGRTFPDTASPWASGRALIADETAALPAPILTPISRFSDGVSAYHYTFYFRHHFTAPIGASAALISLHHVIDDGAIFYLNGVEFHRFNMAAGPVNYLTQANTNVGDGVYNGPFDITVTNSNIVPGDNVIAVEVHQNGTASSDITFGSEVSVTGLSVAPLPPPARPAISIARQGTNVVVSWSGNASILERKRLLSPNTLWAPVTNSPPYVISPGTSPDKAVFYQLQQ